MITFQERYNFIETVLEEPECSPGPALHFLISEHSKLSPALLLYAKRRREQRAVDYVNGSPQQ